MSWTKKITRWSKVLRTRGPSNVIVEIGIGDGQRGSVSFLWERSDGLVEEWDDIIPEDTVLEINLGSGDQVAHSSLDCVVLVKDFNPYAKWTSVDCNVYQKDHPERGHEKELYAPKGVDNVIVPYFIRLTFALS